MTALVSDVTLTVLSDRHSSMTQATEHSTRQQVLRGLDALGEALVGHVPLLLGDDRVVMTREPLTIAQNLAQVDARLQDRADG
jgi:hypothetical protein